MAEFDETRQRYNAARSANEAARTELIRARERARRLDQEAESLTRLANAGRGEAASIRLREIGAEIRDADRRATRAREDLSRAETEGLLAFDLFAEFTDPTTAVERLADDTPVALFPLRIETRFKTLREDGRSQLFLWVRVFPDDALVDSFQPEISQAEWDNVVTYWTHRWRAAGDPAGHRSAWAALVRGHGSGRAKWLTEQVAPLNPGDEPLPNPSQHVLVVRPPAPLSDRERALIGTFWVRLWSSGGAERDAAFADLAGELGFERAAEVEEDLEPVNLRDVAVKPDPSLTPHVVFLDLPDPTTLPISRFAWTRGASAWLLPERLVLLGFRDGQEVLREVGDPIPPNLQIGPDPSAEDGEQIRAAGANLEIPDATRWTVDFDDAVRKGMAFSVNLSERRVEPKFDRLFVLGVRVGSDSDEGASELEELIRRHQSSRKGFAILPQGRPTNNTDISSAGYSWWKDPDESFSQFFENGGSDDPGDWKRRKDGAWLAGALGIDPAVLRSSPHYYGTDQSEARAMNIALWPGTLGYYMDQMMEPVFSNETVLETRSFFNRFVVGRGVVPLVRIGRQPYGVLPTTVWSEMAWWAQPDYARSAAKRGLPNSNYLAKLYALTERALLIWQSFALGVSHVGDANPDAHKTLLDILGLHPGSVEFYQRYSQTFTQFYNTLGIATEPVSPPITAATRRYIQAGLLALSELGWTLPEGGELPEILEKIFHRRANRLNGGLVEGELSETELLHVTRADGRNYIDWIQWAAQTSHDTLRRQTGFADGIPRAILYLMLHHAVDLGFVETAFELRREALQISDEVYRAERREPKFIHISGEQDGRSRYEFLYRPEPAVTGDPSVRLGDFIPNVLRVKKPYLNDQVSALEVLKTASTASLERALAEHIDCLSYRFDAWRMGIQAVQLASMREETDTGFAKGGVYVGAYGWLENLTPRDARLTPVDFTPELEEIFEEEGAPRPMLDSDNLGFIHAPSLDHAVTAAILRNGYDANSTDGASDRLAVDLSSERVRLAQHVLEGVRNGQSLGALLGYRLERALHDEPGLFLDRLIYDLRRAFPLAGNRNRETRVEELESITQVEARNVLDGKEFMDHLEKTGATEYPYDLEDLPLLDEFTNAEFPSAADIGRIIDAHVAKMRRIGDAVGDLAIAEGVYQVVRGNYDRAAGSLDAFSKGTHPPETEVSATPRSGKTLTHRIGLHLEGGLAPDDPRLTTPRAQGEPALARWLAGLLPDPATIFARVIWRDERAHRDVPLTPSMADLGLEPVDLFYLIDAGGERDMPGFDDLLIDFAEQNTAQRPPDDAVFRLEYLPEGVDALTLFEVAPLVRALRGLVLGTRPLRPTDLALQNEAGTGEDVRIVVRTDKVATVTAGLQGTLAALQNFVATLDTAIGDGVSDEDARNAARDQIDQWITDFADAVRPVQPFGLEAASLTTAIAGRRGRLQDIKRALSAIIERWEKKQSDYDTVLARYAALPADASDDERVALLVRAGRIVSAGVIAPIPPIPDLESQVAGLRVAFDGELDNLKALLGGAVRVGATLTAMTAFVPTMEAHDHTPIDLAPLRGRVLALARDLQQKAAFLRDDVARRVDHATDALGRAGAAVGDKAQAAAAEGAQAILGSSFLLLTDFSLSEKRLAEWENVWASRAGLLHHLKRGAEASPFPVDDWLHGVARVREKPRHLELITLLGEALGVAAEPTLVPLQFPHRSEDAWLALRFPETRADGKPFVLEEDKLLYTPTFAAGAEIDPSRPDATYAGLLIDEWVEVIPTDEETTGLAFQFDRPNSEAPQAILLATPPVHRGAWQWTDLVNTLHETLDLARLRAVEPAQIDKSALGPLVPAVVSAVTTLPITAILNFALNNKVDVAMAESSDG